jgi:hypothetical protein
MAQPRKIALILCGARSPKQGEKCRTITGIVGAHACNVEGRRTGQILPQLRTVKRQPAHVEIYATGTNIYVVKTNSFLIAT